MAAYTPRRTYPAAHALLSAGALFGVCLLIYTLLWVSDFGLAISANPIRLFREPGAVDTLTSFAEVTVGVLGVAITVVAIIVELAANRYTPRITELFVRDPVNVGTMSFFVITSVLVLWIDTSLFGPFHPANMALAAVVLMTASLLALLPYFAYVFDFLTPTQVIFRIQVTGTTCIDRLARRGLPELAGSRPGLSTVIEQLGDIGLNSIDKKDKPLTIAAVSALAEVAKTHVAAKGQLPNAWFDTSALVSHDQDFIAFHPDIVRSLSDRRTWVEMKILRQYQAVFTESVNKMRDVSHLIGIHTRRLALFALERDDMHVARLSIRFLNTYMRAALNARDVRTAYNLLNEFRTLAEGALGSGHDDVVREVSQRIKFYGQLAFSANLAFVLESAAYDLCALIERASELESPCHDPLLTVLLDVDREPEGGKVQEASLQGVRKAQIKLATHYLVRGEEGLARRIFEDMRHEAPARLQTIHAQLEAVEGPEFWEVSDRGINFEWLSPERRAELRTFFGWFELDDASP